MSNTPAAAPAAPYNYTQPDWSPLERVVRLAGLPRATCGEFMWMSEDTPGVHYYKHRCTRLYVAFKHDSLIGDAIVQLQRARGEDQFMSNTCKLCGTEVDISKPEGWSGIHRYGCRKVGRVQLKGFLDGWWHPEWCGFCGEPAVCKRQVGNIQEQFYCLACSAHPLRRGGRKDVSPFAPFVLACYSKR